ncbi:MAG: DPP IV N-terminal domain-containing protein, partial [Chitinophagaceae bacterium]|nr:DPP IV N-terminal domain-containing protein [Chitinophagaceae bacterium]
MKKFCFLLILFTQFSLSAFSQQLTKEDYARATKFFLPNLLNKRVYNYYVEPNWFKDSSGFSFITQNNSGKVFSRILLNKKEVENLFDHERLAKSLSDTLKKEMKATDLPITNLQYIDAAHLEFTAENKRYTLDLNSYFINSKKQEQQNGMEQKSPDGKWIAYTDNYNLFIRSAETGETRQLSTSGEKGYEYAAPYGWSDIIEGENGERPKRFQVRWSPDSKWIQTYICDLRQGNKMYLLDWSRDTLYRPVLLSYYRASPGDTNMVYTIPVFFNIETGEEIRRDAGRNTHTFPTYYEWSKKEGIIYEQKRWRGFQRYDITRVNLIDKREELLYSE